MVKVLVLHAHMAKVNQFVYGDFKRNGVTLRVHDAIVELQAGDVLELTGSAMVHELAAMSTVPATSAAEVDRYVPHPRILAMAAITSSGMCQVVGYQPIPIVKRTWRGWLYSWVQALFSPRLPVL